MYLDPAMSPCGGHAAPMSITVSCARPWPQGCSSYLACELASCLGLVETPTPFGKKFQ